MPESLYTNDASLVRLDDVKQTHDYQSPRGNCGLCEFNAHEESLVVWRRNPKLGRDCCECISANLALGQLGRRLMCCLEAIWISSGAWRPALIARS